MDSIHRNWRSCPCAECETERINAPDPEVLDIMAEVGFNMAMDKGEEVERLTAENARLRAGYRAIKKAAVEGRVCDDVAWFDTITTLYDFCDGMLGDEQKVDQA